MFADAAGGPFVWALVAHALVAVALALSYGHDQPVAGLLVLASVGAVCLGLWSTSHVRPRAASAHESTGNGWSRVRAAAVSPGALLWAVALGSTASVLFLAPGVYVEAGAPRGPFVGMAVCAVGIASTYAIDLRTGACPVAPWTRPASMLGLAIGLGAWVIVSSPAPKIDVWQLNQQAAGAVVHGHRVYGPGSLQIADSFWGPTRTVDSYIYPPLSLSLLSIAYALTHETRWAQLAAMAIGAALLWLAARRACGQRAVADLLMICLLFHPRALFVLEQGWVEPLALPFLGGFALCASAGRWRLAAVFLGLLCATKQQFVIYLPALALVPGVGVWGALAALGTLALTYVPALLSTPLPDLWWGLVLYHLGNPFRADSLSLPAMLSNARIFLPTWIGMVAALLSFAVLPWVPRKAGPLLLASSLTFLLFYVLGRQAFCNYYYFLGATWLFAAALLAKAERGWPAGATARAQDPSMANDAMKRVARGDNGLA